MKKVLCGLLSLVMCFSFLTACAANTTTDLSIILQIDNPVMTVNSAEKEIDPGRGTVPVIVNDRTLVPIRAIVEQLGGTVSWEESTQTASLTYAGDEIRLTIDSTTAYLNGQANTLDTAPAVINDRTMLPIRFIAESFHFSVDWNDTDQLITITKSSQIPEESSAENDSHALVVYFSATGNTKALAEKIAEATEADVYEIVPENPYTSEDLNYNNDDSRTSQEINSDARPEIKPLEADIAQYDVLILGYPLWWGQCPPPVRTFLESYDFSDKTIMPFCTSGSTGISGSLSKIRELCPNSTVTEGFRGTGTTTETQITQWLTANGFTAKDTMLKIQVGNTVLTATLVDHSSAAALKELLVQGPLTIEMHDYGNFEKVGSIGKDLPRNDEQITTEPGDLILYQGNSFVIYYDTNSWNFTRLGKIHDVTQAELKEILGSGNVTVTLSIE